VWADHGGVVMARSATGEAVSAKRKSPAALKKLGRFVDEAESRNNLEEWRRGKAVLGYIAKRTVIALASELGVTRGSVNRWLQWYEAAGIDGLVTGKPSGRPPRLTTAQLGELTALIEGGPIAAGYVTGVWTGPIIGDLIKKRFEVSYHNHHVPRLLHQLGFSVQRPRKRLANADLKAQAVWLRETFPKIKKKRPRAEALSHSRTKRASGSTEVSIGPGLLSDVSLA
jgi:transposase